MVITLCGDISITQKNQSVWDAGDAKRLFGGVTELFHGSDRVVVNLECAITEAETAISKFGPNLKGNARSARILKDAGVTDCALSNNHTYDFGMPGLEDTLRTLDELGLNYIGVGENEEDSRKDLIIQQDGKTVRIITVCEHEYSYAMSDFPGARPYDPYDTIDDIRTAKAEADYVIVMYHGGKEHSRFPSPRLRKLCRSMVTHGADLVLCQHSHCIGCVEDFKGGKIVYGQGNFHFLYPPIAGARDDSWNEGLAVRLTLADKADIELIPVVADPSVGIDLAEGTRKEEILSGIESRSQDLYNGKWLEHWREFCLSVSETYRKSIAGFHTGAEQDVHLFAHYLDCEAHTDVWRELYPTFHKAKIGQ